MNLLNIIPQPALRPRVTRKGTYNIPKYANYKKALSILLKAKHKSIFKNSIKLKIVFYMPIPKMSKVKTLEKENQPHLVKPDLDNLIKAFCDSANEIIYIDDKLICEIEAKKYYSNIPRIEYEVKEI